MPSSFRDGNGFTVHVASRCSRSTAAVALLLLLFLSGVAAPSQSHEEEEEATVDPRLGTVTSLAELREFCHNRAPELEDASWVRHGARSVGVRTVMVNTRYAVEAAPVCVGNNGEIFVDEDRYDAGESVLKSTVKYPVYALRDGTFSIDGEQGFATAVPALALLTKGKWIDSHIWHLIRDCLGAFGVFFTRYNNGEMFSLPTQTVQLRGGAKDQWVDRYGDTKAKTALSARVLNSFSSPRRGGPFFSTSPSVKIRFSPPWRSRRARKESVKQRVKRPLMQCYCQAMSVHVKKVTDKVNPMIYYALQDLVTRQFGEDDYLRSLTPMAAETRRVQSHPWASQFWKEATFDVNGTYRPRALVIHRKTRLIGDVEKYVDHLRKLNFRVEEIFPERLPLEQQYHLGRYADLLVGMHGLGVAHAFWMDRFPLGCRSIVEFRPWVTPGLPVDLHRILGRFMGFDYHYPEPIDVTFGDNVKDHTLARTRLMDNAHLHRAFAFPEFTDQTAYYNETKVFALFDKIRKHLDECLRYAQHVPRFSPATGCGA